MSQRAKDTPSKAGEQQGETVVLVDDGQQAKIAGKTLLSDSAVELIAGLAAREIPGVHKLGKGAFKDALHRVAGTVHTRRGVVAEVGTREVAIDLEMVVEYGFNLHDVAEQARTLVIERLEQMTGLRVKEVNIHVADVALEEAPKATRRVE